MEISAQTPWVSDLKHTFQGMEPGKPFGAGNREAANVRELDARGCSVEMYEEGVRRGSVLRASWDRRGVDIDLLVR